MKRLVYQLLLAIVLLAASWMWFNMFLHPRITCKMLEEKSRYTVLIFGDSHGKTIQLPGSVNFSKDAEPISVQHLTYRSVHPCFEKVQTIMIAVGPQNFSRTPIDRFESNRGNWHAFNTSRLAWLDTTVPWFEHIRWKSLVLGEFNLVPPVLDCDGFDATLSTDLSEERLEKTLRRDQLESSEWFRHSSYTDLALMNWCNEITESSARCFLIGTPLHSSYRDRIPHEGDSEYKKLMFGLDSLPQTTYVPLENVSLPDSFFFDADHLNQSGVHWLADTLTAILSLEKSGF